MLDSPMAKPRKSILELKQSGKWSHMTKKEQAKRVAEELGRPLPPPPPAPPPPPLATIPNAEATARDYAAKLIAGVIPAGRLAKLSCQRFVSDLEHGHERGLQFDPASAQHAVDYIGRLGLCLLGWEVFVLANLFGWKCADGSRRFREAFIEIGKKNGKTHLMASVSLYMADTVQGDGEPFSQVYIGATCKAQAQDLCFVAAKRLRAATPSVAERSRAYRSSIVFEDSGSSVEPLASNSERLQGRNIACGILDELADHKDATLYQTFDSSTVGRRQPLRISITTAGQNREGIAWETRNRAIQVLEGLDYDTFFPFICESDEGDSWEDERVWIKANPSLGELITIESLREKFKTAQTTLSQKYSVLRYHLNVWPATSLSPWIDWNSLDEKGNAYLEDSDKGVPVDKRIAIAFERHLPKKYGDLTKLTDAELTALSIAEGSTRRRPFVGGDFALVNDLSALCMLFAPSEPGGIYEAFFRVWIPQENVSRRSQHDKVPYQSWIDQGFAIATPGNCTDFEFLETDILELNKKYKFKELAVDKSLIPDMFQRLERAGVTIVAADAGMRLSPAIRRTEKLIAEHRFCTFGHPIFAWCARNVSLSIGRLKGDCQFEKAKSRERIDVAMAAVLATWSEMAQPQPPSKAADPTKFSVKLIPRGDPK